MKEDEYAGYCCLAIAILCDLNAYEAQKLYQYGPDHPLCKKIMRKKVRRKGLEKLDRKESREVMRELLSQGYSVNAVAEAFLCFPSTVRRRVREGKEKKAEEDLQSDNESLEPGLEQPLEEAIKTGKQVDRAS